MKTYTFTILLVFIAQISFGQKELFGTWKANCPLNPEATTRLKYCKICVSNKTLSPEEFEITFDERGMKFKQDGIESLVEHKWEGDFSAIQFQYNDKDYQFNVVKSGRYDVLILKDEKDLLLVLKRIS